jgi:uroporphyrinogen-III synthase
MIASFEPSELAGRKFLFVRGDKSLRTIPERLGSDAIVDEVVVYRTIEVELDAATITNTKVRLERGAIDWTCFFSPSGVDAFLKLFAVDDARKTKAAAIGETTARHARERGLNVEFVSERANSQEMARGLIEHIRNDK